MSAATIERRWWLCPNGACEHGNVLHDVESLDDERPTCCVDDCVCPKPTAVFAEDRLPPKTVMDGSPACGAPKNWPWGYLPCGCRNDGYRRHVQ